MAEFDGHVRPADSARPPKLLTLALIRRHYIPVSDRTLRRWMAEEAFPRPAITRSARMQLWDRDQVEAWICREREKPPLPPRRIGTLSAGGNR